MALLPDREADTLAAWLHGHPGVSVISRDRLLQNLAQTSEVVFTKHARDLRAAEQGCHDAVAAEDGTLPVPPSAPQASVQAPAAGRRERRIAAHGQVWRLKGE